MRQRRMVKPWSTEYPPVLLLQDLDTQRVSWLNDLVNVPPIRPCEAHFGHIRKHAFAVGRRCQGEHDI